MPGWLRTHGADLPFADRRRAHGVGMEGYFWRFTDPRSQRVIVALCGVCRGRDGLPTWANVALAARSPAGTFLRDADLPHAVADPDRLGVSATGPAPAAPDLDPAPGADPTPSDAHGPGPALGLGPRSLALTGDHLTVDLGPDARLDVRLTDPPGVRRPALGGVGAAHLVPGLGQYWDPHLLGGRASGTAVIGEEAIDLAGWDAYGEKNWGAGGFPDRWWWGQAGAFTDRPDATVAFAGGTVTIGPARLTATGIVVRLGDTLIRLGNPLLAPVQVAADGRRWSLHARGPRHAVVLEGVAGADDLIVLPVPDLDRRASAPAAHQHFAGRLSLQVRRRGRVIYAGESPLAGLESGGGC